MPLYEYECGPHGVFEEARPMSESELAGSCPVCGKSAERIISRANVGRMGRGEVMARDRNEKSRHEPAVVRSEERGPPRSRGMKRGSASRRGGRPWAIGH